MAIEQLTHTAGTALIPDDVRREIIADTPNLKPGEDQASVVVVPFPNGKRPDDGDPFDSFARNAVWQCVEVGRGAVGAKGAKGTKVGNVTYFLGGRRAPDEEQPADGSGLKVKVYWKIRKAK